MLNSKAKATASWTLRALVVLIAWCAMMVLYLKTYDLIEQSAVPVTLATKNFTTNSWNDGYFSAKGSFENQSAIEPGDELPLQTNVVTCLKSDKTCTVATADVFDRYLDLDVSYFDIASWTDQEITFVDDNPICVTNSYVIDRAAQTMTLIVRKRAVIPEYAAKSSLHPCDNTKDKNIDLADGFKVYWRKKTEFEARNGLYFHLALAAINVLFIGAIVWLWRKRKSSVRNPISQP
jgi:hypothetical protein